MQAKKIIVVGAGPAGMMASIRAAELGANTTLIEKNPTFGIKLLLSGKGRCNITNAASLESFLKRFSKNGEFLRDAFKKFFNQDLIEFFEKRGLRMKVERQLRVFPDTDKSSSVLDVLTRELEEKKVKILSKASLKEVLVQGEKVKGVLLENGTRIEAERVILATGGATFKFTGSSEESFNIVKIIGHTIVPLRPGLVALETKEKYPKKLEGLTLKNIKLKFSSDGERIISEIGELLFTDFGISGPLVLSLSGKIIDWLSEGKAVYLGIDLKPALSVQQLNARLLREFSLNPKKIIKNALKEMLPLNLIKVFLEIADINPMLQVSQISKQQREKISFLLKNFGLTISRSRPMQEAMVTRGGVLLKEINPRTMESRLIKGLYFAGEMIDLDADTGGFNLQAAFSTGYLAGESAALN